MSVMQRASVVLLVQVIWSVEGRSLEESQTDDKIECAVCDKKECVATAARILDYIDPQTEPCDDFYQFACGGWVKQQVIPPHRSQLMSFYDQDKHIAKVRGLLAADVEESDLEAVKKAKNLYASCIQYGSRSRTSTTQGIDTLVKARFGVWPLTGRKWNENDFDLQDFLVKAARLSVFPLFTIGVDVDYNNVNGKYFLSHKLGINDPELSLPNFVYTSNDDDSLALQLYTKKILSEANRFGVLDYQQAAQDVADIVEVEKTLAQIISNINDYSGANVNLGSIDEIISSNKLNFTKLVTTLFTGPEVGVTDIDSQQSVVLSSQSNLLNATSYFLDLPPRTQANYIIWRVLDTFYNILLKSTDDKVKNMLDQAVLGVTAKVTVEESCINYVSKAFDLVLHRLLYADQFPPDEIAEVYKILNQVQKEFDVVVHEHHWVDEESRKSILEKNAALGTTLIYYQQAMNDSLLDVIYANLTVDKDDFIENVWKERREKFNRNLRLLRQPYETTLDNLPHEIVAQYDRFDNRMEYTSVIFEPPFYIRDVPSALNYGGVAIVFGHEIVHSFDNKCYQRNHEGRLGDWWSNETVAVFKERSQCLVQQFNNFYYETAGLNVNGQFTLGENMGDQGGIKLAFRAYQKYGKRLETRDQALPGVDYTGDQLFYINFAQLWCHIQNPEAAVNTIKYDPHSPNHFRVIGSVQNSPDFARAFNCPAGSKMNPETKCEVW